MAPRIAAPPSPGSTCVKTPLRRKFIDGATSGLHRYDHRNRLTLRSFIQAHRPRIAIVLNDEIFGFQPVNDFTKANPSQE
jgi:hypothetical protein